MQNILPEDQISQNFDTLRLSYKNQSCQDLWYLAILATWINSNFFTYIIKIKRANHEKRICPLLKNDISTILRHQKRAIYCRNQKIGPGCDIVLWYQRNISHLILGCYCRYHHIFESLIITVFSIDQQLKLFSISWIDINGFKLIP